MKAIYWVLIIGTVLLVLVIKFLFGSGKVISEENICDYWHKENCDYSCNVDSACHVSACTCVNKNEEILLTRKLPDGSE